MKNHKNILRLTRTAIISAVAIVLSVLESMLPIIPVPGMKLGLSNIASMFAAGSEGIGSAVTVSVIKSLFVLITRGFTAFLMSFFGGLASTLVMCLMLCFKKKYFGYIGVGVVGAAIHNTVQIFVACVILDFTVITYLPVLLFISVITGCITGFTVGIILPRVEKNKLFMTG